MKVRRHAKAQAEAAHRVLSYRKLDWALKNWDAYIARENVVRALGRLVLREVYV